MFRTFSIEEREEMKRKQLSRENIGFCTVREGRYDEIRCRHHERISRNLIHTHPALSNYVLFSFNFAIRGKPVVLVSHFFFPKKHTSEADRVESGRVRSAATAAGRFAIPAHTITYKYLTHQVWFYFWSWGSRLLYHL